VPAQLAGESLLDALGDGADLAIGVAVTDQEEIGDVTASAEVENDGILGFLVQRGLDAADDLEGCLSAQWSFSCR
jgi:hypothetical protein